MGEFYFKKFVFKSFLTLTNILPYISPNSFSRKFLLRTYFTLTNSYIFTRNIWSNYSYVLFPWQIRGMILMNVRENCGRKYNWNNTLTNTEKEYRGALLREYFWEFISENALHFYSTNYFPKNIFLSIISLVSFQDKQKR